MKENTSSRCYLSISQICGISKKELLMFDDLMDPPDCLDCMMDIHKLKEEAKILPNETLVEVIVEFSTTVAMNDETELALTKFFNYGTLDPNERQLIENCYVLLKNYLCVDIEDGEIRYTVKYVS
jgi:hypothetical protein